MSLRSNWKVTITLPRRAVLRIGLFTLKWSPVSVRVAIATWLLSVGIYLALFAWHYSAGMIAHVYPSGAGNWWAGLLNGYFILPSFVMSWFNPDITIYQSPNNGFWYNLLFLVGISALLSAMHDKD